MLIYRGDTCMTRGKEISNYKVSAKLHYAVAAIPARTKELY